MSDGPPTIPQYFGMKGVEGIFARLEPPEGKLNGELENSVDISANTLDDRLRTGEEMGLIEQTLLPGDHGNSKRYVLTERGEAIRDRMVEIEFVETYSLYFETKQLVEIQRGEIQEWLQESDITEPWWPPGPDINDDLPGT